MSKTSHLHFSRLPENLQEKYKNSFEEGRICIFSKDELIFCAKEVFHLRENELIVGGRP
jgi:hypothetical protein